MNGGNGPPRPPYSYTTGFNLLTNMSFSPILLDCVVYLQYGVGSVNANNQPTWVWEWVQVPTQAPPPPTPYSYATGLNRCVWYICSMQYVQRTPTINWPESGSEFKSPHSSTGMAGLSPGRSFWPVNSSMNCRSSHISIIVWMSLTSLNSGSQWMWAVATRIFWVPLSGGGGPETHKSNKCLKISFKFSIR